MIKTNFTNSLPMTLRGMASSIQVTSVEPFMDEDSYDVCVCDGCDFEEDAYVNNGGEGYKNDWKSFIGKRKFSTDTITFKLVKGGVVVATLNSSTYGTYYNFGDALFVNDLVNFPDYKGFIIDWNLVQQGFGYGKYVVRVEIVSLGVTYTKDSHTFNVVEYNAYRADGSVKIEGYQTGFFQKYFDYTGLNWPQMMRIRGKFGNKTPNLTVDNYENYSRYIEEVGNNITDFYELSSELLPSNIFNFINYTLLRANTLLITDYNLLNQELYRQRSVYFNNFKEVKNEVLSRKSSFVYQLVDKVNNDIKRNALGDLVASNPILQQINGGNVCTLEGNFMEGTSTMGAITITARNSGTYTSVADDGASGTLTFNKNSAGFVAFSSPLVLQTGDTLDVQRTVTSADGYYILTGTF
jgi:hypothetical protein